MEEPEGTETRKKLIARGRNKRLQEARVRNLNINHNTLPSLPTRMDRPAWQTDELADEWVEEDSAEHEDDGANGNTTGDMTRSVSLTIPLPSHIKTYPEDDAKNDKEDENHPASQVGTFLVREDAPAAVLPMLPKTPGKKGKGAIKDFFTPLPLERMFEPPSPPAHIIPSNDSPITATTPNLPISTPPFGQTQFTFSVPSQAASGGIQAQSTPAPHPPAIRNVPSTDPRLRLFQFQYDTFTRDHLSAMVDSIAVNNPSGDSEFNTFSVRRDTLSPVTEVSSVNQSRFRSAKRVKLSPKSDLYGEGAGENAQITRAKAFGKDYVGDARDLMQQIRQARDFSTISTVASAAEDVRGPSPAPPPEVLSKPDTSTTSSGRTPSTSTTLTRPHSAASIRQNALAFMAQMKNDMKAQRRIFSGDTESTSTRIDEKSTVYPANNDKLNPPVQVIVTEPTSPMRCSQSSSSSSLQMRSSGNRRPRPASMDVERELATGVQNLSLRRSTSRSPSPLATPREGSRPSSPQATTRPRSGSHAALGSNPPPSSSANPNPNDDLNRFVSSSTTASTGTAVTNGSAGSFVKHAGPPQLRHIRPQDIPTIPNRVGNMEYDVKLQKWVKKNDDNERGDGRSIADASEDPFRDIESLREDESERDDMSVHEEQEDGEEVVEEELVEGEAIPAEEEDEIVFERHEISVIDERSEGEEAEDVEINSFSFDDASAEVVQVMPRVEVDGSTDSEDEDEDDAPFTTGIVDDSQDYEEEQTEEPKTQHLPLPVQNTPLRSVSTPMRSALKSTSATPQLGNPNRYQTPAPKDRQRSVSFSDGKHDGPIRGLNESTDVSSADLENTIASQFDLGFQPSARSKRIADMMEALEHSDTEEMQDASLLSRSTGPNGVGKLDVHKRRVPSSVASIAGTSPGSRRTSRVFSRPSPGREPSSSSSLRRRVSDANATKGDATFLTECSFGVSHDKLVQVITDVQPYEPYWEDLVTIDLSGKGLESVARLKEFLPRLDTLCLNSNSLNFLSGVPGTVRTLSIASNMLTGMTSYSHLGNLQCLDVSRNEIDSLRQLSCLRHLTELKADGNKIGSLDGLQRMERLIKLSVASNRIKGEIDLTKYSWGRLEMLNLSENRVEGIHGLEGLSGLIAFNADGNALTSFSGRNNRLRILRLSNNRLTTGSLDVSGMSNLKTLYVDQNALGNEGGGELVRDLGRLSRLENLSARNQWSKSKTSELGLKTRDVRDSKRLYLSGNGISLKELLTEPCYQLVYLELASCRLTSLPACFSTVLPNLRSLNLNYNFLGEGAGVEEALSGLKRMKKLTMVGSRLRGTKVVIRILRGMPDVEMADFRMNPCTLEWYLPLMVKENGEWKEMDGEFRRTLPDRVYAQRMLYRGLAMSACPLLKTLDGIEVTGKERAKAVALAGVRKGGLPN